MGRSFSRLKQSSSLGDSDNDDDDDDEKGG
jgi:hypothetical protein